MMAFGQMQTFHGRGDQHVGLIAHDVTQSPAVGPPSDVPGQSRVYPGERLNLVIASVMGRASEQSARWQKRPELRGNKLALVHCDPWRTNVQGHKLRTFTKGDSDSFLKPFYAFI
jgi:hypothetical protein